MTEPTKEAPAPGFSLLVSVIVATAFFMETLDSTVIVTALPRMAETFGTGAADLSIGLTAYILTLAVMIPVSGWMADRFGARNVFCVAIGVFMVSSMLCGLSGDLWEFVGARVLQGMGGAMMSPVGRLVVLRSTPKENLVRAINFVTFPGLIGPVVGPPVGGFITTYASWRWIFFLNVPVGLIGMVLVCLFIRNYRSETRRAFDRAGFVLNGLALAAIIYGMSLVGGRGGDWVSGLGLTLAGVAIGAAAIRHALKSQAPLVDLKAFRVTTYAATNTGGSAFRISVAAPTFVMPLMFQVGLGMTAFASGMLILAHAGGDLAMKTITTRTVKFLGFRTALIWSATLFAALIASCALFTPTTPKAIIVVVLFFSGAIRSLQMTALGAMQFADIPPAGMTGASTLSSVLQQVVRAIGIAFAALLINLAASLRGSGAGMLTLGDFRVAFLATATLALVAVRWYVPLAPDTGAHVSGHRGPSPKPAPEAAEAD